MSDTAVIEQAPHRTTLSQLEQLRRYSKIVADPGDFQVFKEFAAKETLLSD